MEPDEAVERIRALAARVGVSRENANGIVDLVDTCSSEEPRAALAALQSCRALFTQWAMSGDLVRHGDDAGASDALALYREWLWRRYSGWLDVLGAVVARHESMGVRLPALDTLMHMAKVEGAKLRGRMEAVTATLGKASGAFACACEALTHCADCEPQLLAHIKRGYALEYVDVCYYLMQQCAHLASRLAANQSTPTRCARLLDLLVVARPPRGDLYAAKARFLTLQLDGANEESAQALAVAKKKRGRLGAVAADGLGGRNDGVEAASLPSDARRLLSRKVHRLAFQAAWLEVLKLPLARREVRRILVRAEDHIVPHMPRPLKLAGWLLRIYERGGLLALLSLSALFTLMQEHNLECPDFFPKLYALVDERALESPHRERFFLLVELFLSSALLPAYLTAAFAKRLAHLALHASPDGCQIALALILNLIIRHPELTTLIHRVATNAPSLSLENGSTVVGDPYLSREPDPAKCHALESSLWEVDTLRSHYLPAVAQMADKFTLPLHGAQAKVSRLEVDDYTEGNYDTFFRQELSWRRGRPTPLAFAKRRALFADDDHEALGLRCFSLAANAIADEVVDGPPADASEAAAKMQEPSRAVE